MRYWPKNQQSNIKPWLKLIEIGMRSALLKFRDKYSEYNYKRIETNVLAIGGYDEDFLFYLVAS